MDKEEAMEVYRLVRRRFPNNEIPGGDWEFINWTQNTDGYWQRVSPEFHKLTVCEDYIDIEGPKGSHILRVQKPAREYFYGVPVEFIEKNAD